MKDYVLGYIIAINVISALVCAADKIKAIRHKRRIRERTLWILSLAGGSAGMYLTMLLIRHKTLHAKFMIGIPLIIVLQIILCLLLTKLYPGHIIA